MKGIGLFHIVYFFIPVIWISGCERFDPVEKIIIKTRDFSEVTTTDCKVEGELIDMGEESELEVGFCWSVSPTPDLQSDTLFVDRRSEKGVFAARINGLKGSTTYYYRAYGRSGEQVVFGDSKAFTTERAQLARVTTDSIDMITDTSAIVHAEVLSDGGSDISEYGICWDTLINPTIQENRVEGGSGTGRFTLSISHLVCGTEFFVRAYAINEMGVSYSSNISFKTSDCVVTLPEVLTFPIDSVSHSVAISGGKVLDEGGATVYSRGICWSTEPWPTLEDSYSSDSSGWGPFVTVMTGLECETNYYIRAYATNMAGTSYGEQRQFTTGTCPVALPTVVTLPVTEVTAYSMTCSGEITNSGGSDIIARGLCWSTAENPTLAENFNEVSNSPDHFSSTIKGLDCNTVYYLRAYATNAIGTSYGEMVSSSTNPCPGSTPQLLTPSVSEIGEDGVTVRSDVVTDGGAEVTSRGICWSLNVLPTLNDDFLEEGTGTGEYTIQISHLEPLTRYYIRSFAVNEYGTAYSSSVSFSTLGIISDVEGNQYQVVQIGNQVWMMENLRTTRYADGEAIPVVGSSTGWSDLPDPDGGKALCWYDNDTLNRKDYGHLYTWAAATRGTASDSEPSGVQGVCPDGWHIPSDEEWKTLEIHLGMTYREASGFGGNGYDEGGKLKETGTLHWLSPNVGATNESGFTALPGGYRSSSGIYREIQSFTMFWTASEHDGQYAFYRGLGYDHQVVIRNYTYLNNGLSVRCVRNPEK